MAFDFQKHTTRSAYIFILISMLSWIIPYKTSGQDLTKKIVSINETNITVSNALDKIYKAYSIKFAFNAKELNKFKIENVSMKEKPLGEVLNQLLKGTGHLYKSIGNQIVIYKDSEAEKTESREVPKPKAKDNPKTIEKPAEPINIRPSNDTIFKHDTVFLTKTITLRDTITLKDTIIIYKDYDSKAALKKIRDRKYSVRMAYSQELTSLSATPQKEELKDLSLRSFGVKIEGGHRKR